MATESNPGNPYGGKPLPKLPFRPLYDRADCNTAADFAAVVGSSERAVRSYLLRGVINYLQADRYACRLGFHPYEVWGEAWLELDMDIEDVA